ncbi:flavocytochrome c [Nemania sp. FL0916]|nr:flavocytochrome c [Nemania sp. FL0916]
MPQQPAVIIIVGSGLAGLAAAYAALQAIDSDAQVHVHMLERAPKPGGNSIKASSGINGAGTKFQAAAGITGDCAAFFYGETIGSAITPPHCDSGDDLVKKLTDESKDAVEWLAGEMSVDMSVVTQLGGHRIARTHRGATGPPPGAAIVGALLKHLSADARFTLTTNATVESLIAGPNTSAPSPTNPDTKPDINPDTRTNTSHETGTITVTGVKYTHDGTQHSLHGPVIFTAGGFAGDAHGMLASQRPDLAGLPSTNSPGSAPHSLLSSREIDAAFVDMQRVQVHPTGFVDPKEPEALYKILAAEALRGEGGILIDGESGGRFVDELQRRDLVSAAVMGLPPREESKQHDGEGDQETNDGETSPTTRQYPITLLLDPGAAAAARTHLGFYLAKGLMKKVKIRDLSSAIIQTIDTYSASVAAGHDSEFGRTSFGHWSLQPGEGNRDEEVVVGDVTPVTHFTMGGVVVDECARVMRCHAGGGGKKKEKDLEPVHGLWAAGEVTGGIHGENRLGGSSLLECVVFGKIAGEEAVKSLALAGK